MIKLQCLAIASVRRMMKLDATCAKIHVVAVSCKIAVIYVKYIMIIWKNCLLLSSYLTYSHCNMKMGGEIIKNKKERNRWPLT